MTSHFKRKSKSLPQLRKRIYAKIGLDSRQEKWKLSQVVRELSKAQFDISNENQIKFSVRQNLVVKKQIIKKLQSQQIEEGLTRLRQLSDKIPLASEAKRIRMIIVFLEGRTVLQQCLTKNSQEYAIVWLKNKMGEFLSGNEVNFIKVKLLTLLSLLLLKYHGILMVAEENKILHKTIELKQKKLLLIDSNEEKQTEFESLLYVLSEFYKILHLLKKGEQVICFYYNQLAAYTEAYTLRQKLNSNIDLKQIDNILQTMKPVLHDLNIYQDCRYRRECAIANVQDQIAQNQHLPSHIVRPSTRGKGDRKFINSKISIQSRPSAFSTISVGQSKKLIIQQTPKQIQLQEVTQKDTAAIGLIQKHGLSLSFSMMAFSKLYLLQLDIVPRNCFTLLDITLSVTNQRSMPQIYGLRGVQTLVETLTLANTAKFIEALIKKIFKIEFDQFRDLYNIQVGRGCVPAFMDCQHMVPALIRSKMFIKEYLQHNYTQDQAVGNKFVFPNCSLSEVKESLLCDMRQREMRKEKGIFLKRKGQMQGNIRLQNDNRNNADSGGQVCLRFLFKDQRPNKDEYFAFNLFYNECFKGVDVHCFSDQQQAPDLTDYIPKFKQISHRSIEKSQRIDKEAAIQSVLTLRSPVDRTPHRAYDYNIEEQLQSRVYDTSVRTCSVKRYSSVKLRGLKWQQNAPKQYQVVRTIGKQYYLFEKQSHGSYIVYHNDQAKIYLAPDWQSLGWNLEKKRLRMYSGIKIVVWKNSQKHFLKVTKPNQALVIQQQQIALKLTQHHILRHLNGYCIVQEYRSQTGECLYEVIVGARLKYHCITFQKIHNIKDNLNLGKRSLGGYKLDLYSLGRTAISEANHYFLQTRRGRFRI